MIVESELFEKALASLDEAQIADFKSKFQDIKPWSHDPSEPRVFNIKMLSENEAFYVYQTDGVMMTYAVKVGASGVEDVELNAFDNEFGINSIDLSFSPISIADFSADGASDPLMSDFKAQFNISNAETPSVEGDVCEIKDDSSEEPSEALCETDLSEYISIGEGLSDAAAQFEAASTDDGIQITKKTADEELEEAESSRPYIPASQACRTLETIVPNSMRFEIFKALQKLDSSVGGVDEYVAKKLGYLTEGGNIEEGIAKLCDALSSEQVDATALGIHNIETKDQSIIVADQTGIGKGRVASAILRYAHLNNAPKKPIFVTEKPNLFSDIYRDFIDIGSDDGVPYMVWEEDVAISYEKFARKFGKEFEDEDEMEAAFESEEITEAVYKKNKNFLSEIKGKKRMIPFILNGSSDKAQIKDKNKNVLYKGSSKEVDKLKKIYSSEKNIEKRKEKVREFLSGFDIVIATYSQFNKVGWKQDFLRDIASDNIIVMDESHTAGGSASGATSNTSLFFRSLLVEVKGVCFLSATFSKTPNNMPIYAEKTSIKEAGLEQRVMIEAFAEGGTALQEIVSSQLASEGQLIRRERSFQDVETSYTYLDESQNEMGRPQFNLKQEHSNISDNIMDIYRKIIEFQREYVFPYIDERHGELMEFVEILKGDTPDKLITQMGYSPEEVERHLANYKEAMMMKSGSVNVDWNKISQQPVTASFFNFYNQMLFALAAEAVSDMAIEYMKEGRKPFIAVANTMEAFLSNMKSVDGRIYQVNEEIPFDFNMVLLSILEKTLYYVERDIRLWETYGDTTEQRLVGKRYRLDLRADISLDAEIKYKSLRKEIIDNLIGLPNSPIDFVLDRIRKSGFTVEEITGRSLKLEVRSNEKAVIRKNRLKKVNDAFNEFNRNEIDCVLVNQVGSTGASAHAIEIFNDQGEAIVKFNPKYNAKGELVPPSDLNPKDEVKQRVMLVLQAELDINKEVQKRGRINRTGQVYLPKYEYVSTSIPAQQRIMMMLQRKMKSLDANTTGNQKQSSSIININQANQQDFLNKYGDDVVMEWIESSTDNSELNDSIGNPISSGDKKSSQDAAYKFTGKIGIASVKQQERFYDEINPLYREEINFLKALGEYDLEVEKLDLEAKTLEVLPAIIGNGGTSVFGKDSVLEKVEINPIKKPYTLLKIQQAVKNSLVLDFDNGQRIEKDSDGYNSYYFEKINEKQEVLIAAAIKEVELLYNRKIENIDDDNYISKHNQKIDTKINKNVEKIQELKEDTEISDEARASKIAALEDDNRVIESGRSESIEQAKNERIDEYRQRIANQHVSIRKRFEQNSKRIIRIMRSFPIGKPFYYPALDFKDTADSNIATVLGYVFSSKDDNPFVPSKVRVQIAIASSQVSVEIPLSKETFDEGGEITRAAESRHAPSDALERWDAIVEKYTGRVTRYIVTGNILQAMGNSYLRTGRLVKYTIQGGGIKEGILLPDNFNPYDEKFREKLRISIPLAKARAILETLNDGERAKLIDYNNNLHTYDVEKHFTGAYLFNWASPLTFGKRTANKKAIQKEAEQAKEFFEISDVKNGNGEIISRGYLTLDDGTYQFINSQSKNQLKFTLDKISEVIDYGIANFDWRIEISYPQFNKIKEDISLNVESQNDEEITRLFTLLFEKEVEYEKRVRKQNKADELADLDDESTPEDATDINDLIEQNESATKEAAKQSALKELVKLTSLIKEEGSKASFAEGGEAKASKYSQDSFVDYVDANGTEMTGKIDGLINGDRYLINNGSTNDVVEESNIIRIAKDQKRLHSLIQNTDLSEDERLSVDAISELSSESVYEIINSTFPTNKRTAAIAYYKKTK